MSEGELSGFDTHFCVAAALGSAELSVDFSVLQLPDGGLVFCECDSGVSLSSRGSSSAQISPDGPGVLMSRVRSGAAAAGLSAERADSTVNTKGADTCSGIAMGGSNFKRT